MKTRYVVLIVIGLFIFFMGFQAWLETTITPGHMFTVRNDFSTVDLGLTVGSEPNRPCRIAPGASIFILDPVSDAYLAVHFTQTDTAGTDLCRHQATFIASEKDIEAMCGGIFERASGLGY